MFKIDSYKDIIKGIIKSYPNKGRGIYTKLATHLNTSSVVISQIFNGNKDLNTDQAFLVSEFFQFNNLEKDYFLLLVSRERSGTHQLKLHYENKIQKLREDSEDIEKRVNLKTDFPDQAKQLFYSDWLYGGLRMAAGLPNLNQIQDLADYFKRDYKEIKSKVDFLIQHGLIQVTKGKIQFGLQSTHLSSDSPFINQHRKNWRLRAMEKMSEGNKNDLFYVGPMVLSEKLAAELRKELVNFIAHATKRIGESPNEKTLCLNIDLFTF